MVPRAPLEDNEMASQRTDKWPHAEPNRPEATQSTLSPLSP